MRPVSIYVLSDPRTMELRYVGQTNRPVERRLQQHIRDARKQTIIYSSAWINGILDSGLKPDLTIIEEYDDPVIADEAEQFWIQYFRSIGCRLVNRAIGGRSIRGWRHSSEQCIKWREERRGERAPRFGDPKSPEERAKLSASMKRVWQVKPHPFKGRKHSDATRKLIAENRAKNPPKVSPEGRDRQVAALRQASSDPLLREKKRQRMMGTNNPNFGKKMLPHVLDAILNSTRRGFHHSEETKSKMRLSAIERERKKRNLKTRGDNK
jgi:hypothetical protein